MFTEKRDRILIELETSLLPIIKFTKDWYFVTALKLVHRPLAILDDGDPWAKNNIIEFESEIRDTNAKTRYRFIRSFDRR